jgi:hypothetical protein
MSDCSERQVVRMLPKALKGEMAGGLAGGDAKRAVCRRGAGADCDASHGIADGRSIATTLRVAIKFDMVCARVLWIGFGLQKRAGLR